MASAVGGLCEHATIAFNHLALNTARKTTRVGAGIDIGNYASLREVVAAAKSGGHLGDDEYNDVMAMVAGAESRKVWSVVETEPNQYVVLDTRTRTSEHDWACVKFDKGGGARSMTPGRNFMCRVS